MSTARFFSIVAGLMSCIVIVGVVGVVRTPTVISSVVEEVEEVVEETTADVVQVITNPPRTLAPTRPEESEEDESDDDDSEDAPTVTKPAPTTPTAPTSSEKTFTLADVAKHAIASDCYTVIDGSVYDLTPFERSHPGGVANITTLCGIDGTSAYRNQHGGDRRPASELSSLKIGVLAK